MISEEFAGLSAHGGGPSLEDTTNASMAQDQSAIGARKSIRFNGLDSLVGPLQLPKIG
jgi:hypothetical protein